MTESWTPYMTAQALLEILPQIRQLISTRIRETGMDEATAMLSVLQGTVLMHIKDGPITISDLAKRRKVSLQAASVLAQGLVERGWLVRIPDPNDRRRSLLKVTDEGMKRAQNLQDQITCAATELLSELTPEELAAAAIFLPALRRIVDNPGSAHEKQLSSIEQGKDLPSR